MELGDREPEESKERQESRLVHRSVDFVIGWGRIYHGNNKEEQIYGKDMGVITSRVGTC